MTFLTGVVYPFSVTLLGNLLFPEKASGSLVRRNGVVAGSELLAQKFTQDRYFHPRPSASDYQMIGSSASQKSVLKAKGQKMLTSASGLDPHISPEEAQTQINRVAAARSLSIQRLKDLLEEHTEGATLGIWGQPRLNVLRLNMSLDQLGDHVQSR